MIYGRIQDSLVVLKGLKLIRLTEKGVFQQMDSLENKGKWGLSADREIHIEGGGKGFDDFKARFTDYKDGMLRVTEFVKVDGESLKLIWNLKRLTGKKAANLFSDENNSWRRRPAQPETEKQMKERLSQMLRYYSDYYQVVEGEANYFVPTRIVLPLKFYQHAMGMSDFDEESFFASLFYSKDQASKAYDYLADTIDGLHDDFETSKSYVQEYAWFLGKMAVDIVK